jgi:CMP-N-acetylneuraminic acid synthetase
LDAPYFLQTHSTNPLLRPQTIERAIQVLLSKLPKYDSLFSVTRVQTRLWSIDSMPINHDPSQLLRTQDLEPVFLENSAIYLFERQTFLARKNRIGARPFMFELGAVEGWDIDTESDFALLDCIARECLDGSLDILMEA